MLHFNAINTKLGGVWIGFIITGAERGGDEFLLDVGSGRRDSSFRKVKDRGGG